jgi:spermidine synthase
LAETRSAASEKHPSQHFWSLVFAIVLFFFSGASSLIYQVIWTRQMVFIFGSTSFASATVLSAFMGGLAIGSYSAGRVADKIKNPFLLYGLLEGAIGITALSAPFLFDAVLPIYKSFWLQFHLSLLPFSLLRFLIVFFILIIPTACMGATLPLLSRVITDKLSVVGSRVGLLYSINTLGAVFGAISGGFLLIPNLGLNASTMLAAAGNVILALSVVGLNSRFLSMAQEIPILVSDNVLAEKMDEGKHKKQSKRKKKKRQQEKAAEIEPTDSDSEPKANRNLEEQSTSSDVSKLSRDAIFIMICFGISGAIAMIYEVSWTRALLLIVGSTTYAFSIMLSTFLIGIFLGSLLATRIVDRLNNAALSFALLQVILGLAGMLAIFLFNYLPYLNLAANNFDIHNADLGMTVRFFLSGLVFLPITLVLGASFPFAVKACTADLERLGRSVGTLYSVNTMGAIVGSFAAGFFIIPALGVEQTLIACSAANTVCGAILLFNLQAENRNLLLVTGSSLCAISLLFWAWQKPEIWDIHALTSSQKSRRGLTLRTRTNLLPFQKWKADIDKSFQILFRKDGMCANVVVVEYPDKQRALFTNGHIDASDTANDMPTQILLPSIPLLLHPHPLTMADVGWGSGCTMGYALLFPIENMVCAEIEPSVVETSSFFHHVNLAPEKDKRLRIEINDGRNYLLATEEKFDVISSEPSNPWQAGVCNLYTKEYFQICHDRLKPGGIFAMWWQFNEVPHDDLARVFAALKKIFKHVVVFQTFPGDIAACASDEPIKINLQAVEQCLKSNPQLRRNLAAHAHLEFPEDLALRVCITDEAIDKLLSGVQPNTDDRNYIEFDVSRTYEQKLYSQENYEWMTANSGKPWDMIDWTNYSDDEKARRLAGIAERAFLSKNPLASAWAVQSLRVKPNYFAMCLIALSSAQVEADFKTALYFANEAVNKFPQEVKPLCVRGIVELEAGAPLKARRDFSAALLLDPSNRLYKYKLAQTYMPDLRDWYQIASVAIQDDGVAQADPERFIDLASPLLNDPALLKQNPQALAFMGAAQLSIGKCENAISALDSYLKYKPDDIRALRLISEAYRRTGETAKSQSAKAKADQLAEILFHKFCLGAEKLWADGKDNLAVAALRKAIELCPEHRKAQEILIRMAPGSKAAAELLHELSGLASDQIDQSGTNP